jgi:hypothetical protein
MDVGKYRAGGGAPQRAGWLFSARRSGRQPVFYPQMVHGETRAGQFRE